MNWWARLIERWRCPYGRCSRHDCPIDARSGYGGYAYESMDIEFCPQCEDEEATAKWTTIKSRKPFDDSTPILLPASA